MTSPQLRDLTDTDRVPTYEVLPPTPTGESTQPVIKFAKMYAPKLSAKQGMSIDRAFDATIRSLHLLQTQRFKKDCRVWLHKSPCAREEHACIDIATQGLHEHDSVPDAVSAVDSANNLKKACSHSCEDLRVHYKKDNRCWLHKSSARSKRPSTGGHFRLEESFAAKLLACSGSSSGLSASGGMEVEVELQDGTGLSCRRKYFKNGTVVDITVDDKSTAQSGDFEKAIQMFKYGLRPSLSDAEYMSDAGAPPEVAVVRHCISNPSIPTAVDRVQLCHAPDDSRGRAARELTEDELVAWKFYRMERARDGLPLDGRCPTSHAGSASSTTAMWPVRSNSDSLLRQPAADDRGRRDVNRNGLGSVNSGALSVIQRTLSDIDMH